MADYTKDIIPALNERGWPAQIIQEVQQMFQNENKLLAEDRKKEVGYETCKSILAKGYAAKAKADIDHQKKMTTVQPQPKTE